ncbi:hypothetical protein EVJ32_05095 [Exiguobacterium sp. SH5S4]|uniref:hypothetical protein n=1 Tax=Exiguobacterium sp. SH5S4 TaxID=2510961 RepID=UPI00103AECC9|nr:hypothetical protein [Exiguobacterium sp. SH5S4]TCI26754.1 hypothetical protein EVJ32_05095 [Exiguobacterium sp. SH5S4]
MKILAQKEVSSDIWGEYMATRRIIGHSEKSDVFVGKEDGLIVILTNIGSDSYLSTLVAIDWPSVDGELYTPNAELVDEIVGFIES